DRLARGPGPVDEDLELVGTFRRVDLEAATVVGPREPRRGDDHQAHPQVWSIGVDDLVLTGDGELQRSALSRRGRFARQVALPLVEVQRGGTAIAVADDEGAPDAPDHQRRIEPERVQGDLHLRRRRGPGCAALERDHRRWTRRWRDGEHPVADAK